jgi:protein-S-isoprenylcysteine O-methyltransferase Ste14
MNAALLLYAVASRLAYVFFVGSALRREERTQYYARAFGVEDGFQRFRRTASIIMNHDAVAFILCCVLTRETLRLPLARPATIAAGMLLAVVGLGTKLWAARTLGSDAYYWRNFFAPEESRGPAVGGPYRFFNNPMYTIGYLQTYGLALIFASLPGLIVAVFLQASILAFYVSVEKPHFERLHGSS